MDWLRLLCAGLLMGTSDDARLRCLSPAETTLLRSLADTDIGIGEALLMCSICDGVEAARVCEGTGKYAFDFRTRTEFEY